MDEASYADILKWGRGQEEVLPETGESEGLVRTRFERDPPV